MNNKITVLVILLLPAIGVGVLYFAVQRQMKSINTPDPSDQKHPTKVIRYTPPADLPDEVRTGGGCAAHSIAAPYRQDAWRCMAGNAIYEPCFALPKNGSVLCGVNPLTGSAGFELKLTTPLPPAAMPPARDSGNSGWLLQLSDNTYCTPFTGTRPFINGAVGYYSCASSKKDENVMLIGELKNTTPAWTATKAIFSVTPYSSTLKSSSDVSITTLWQ